MKVTDAGNAGKKSVVIERLAHTPGSTIYQGNNPPLNPSDAANKISQKVNNPVSAADISSAEAFDLSTQFESLIKDIYNLQSENNARMQENAERQMRFQDQSQAKSMQFNAEQAQLDRDWQEYMSNTAHQRETADLIAAGLNPVLSANGGAAIGGGASASSQAMSGAMADVDTSITNFYGNLVGAYASMHNAEVNAKAALGAASINASASKAIAAMNLDQPSSLFGTINKLLNASAFGISGGSAKSWSDIVKAVLGQLF